MESRSWFGEPDFNLGGSADDWAEGYLEPQVKGQFTFPGTNHRLCGRLSAIASGTRGGLDAAGSNFDDRAPTDITLEEAYLAAIGEDLLPLEQESVVALSVGPQDYKLGTGFLVLLRRLRRRPSRRVLDRSPPGVRVRGPRHADPRRRLRRGRLSRRQRGRS